PLHAARRGNLRKRGTGESARPGRPGGPQGDLRLQARHLVVPVRTQPGGHRLRTKLRMARDWRSVAEIRADHRPTAGAVRRSPQDRGRGAHGRGVRSVQLRREAACRRTAAGGTTLRRGEMSSERPMRFLIAVCIALALGACADKASKEEEEAAKNTFVCQLQGERLVIRFDASEARMLMPSG